MTRRGRPPTIGMSGKHHTEKTKHKIRERLKGNKNNLGNIYSEKTKIRMSEVMRGERNSMYGRKAEKSPTWKGGLTPKNKLVRDSEEYSLWRKSIFIRDKFTCQKYGVNYGGLIVHHINNFADFLELRFAIDNGITLSKKAHQEFHKKYGYKNNTKLQLEEFLGL